MTADRPAASSSKSTAIDPICGMRVDPEHPRGGSFGYRGHDYFFCSVSCKAKFSGDPEAYLSRRSSLDSHAAEHASTAPSNPHHGHGSPTPAEPVASGSRPVMRASFAPAAVRYFCPMHPEVVRDAPDHCPECGMALEPMDGTMGEENPELRSMERRLWPSVALSLPVLFLSMGPMLPVLNDLSWPSPMVSGWIQALCTTPVVVWCAAPFFARAWEALRHKRSNMFTLISLGTAAAFGFSWLVLLFPHTFGQLLVARASEGALRQTAHGELPFYFEAAAVITALVIVGQVLELRAREQTSQAIRGLLELAPPIAHRLIEAGGSARDRKSGTNEEHDVLLAEVRVGDKLRIRPGERVPVDGVVLEGKSAVDEAMVTGEPVPLEKLKGDKLVGGTLNGTGTLVMRAERVGEQTLLGQIVRLVIEARQSRAPVQRLADRVSAWLVPLVIAASGLTALGWGLWGPEPSLVHALANAVSVLIIACPCALGLATPMSLMVGLGRGAQSGVLIKNAEALENLARVDTLVVDKTGTLTEGKPRVVSVVLAAGASEDEVLGLAAGLERASEHPYAQAILARAQARRVVAPKVHEFQAVVGRGVQGHVAGRPVALGTRALLQELGVRDEALDSQAQKLREQGQTVLFLAADGAVLGLFGVTDPIKHTTREAIGLLHEEGVRIVMATGDHRESAQRVARALGIDEVEAELMPEGKLSLVKRLQREGRVVAMAGDGVNDAPALAAADVSIAMGKGSDVALANAQVTLVKGDLRGIAKARLLALSTMGNIRQNLGFAFAYNLLGVPLAAGLLYPAFGLLLSPMVASAAMSLSSVSVIANALRLRRLEL